MRPSTNTQPISEGATLCAHWSIDDLDDCGMASASSAASNMLFDDKQASADAPSAKRLLGARAIAPMP